LLGGKEAPTFLFTAGHGLAYSAGDPDQEDGQGALVCQDWPGLGNPVQPGHVFAAADLGSDARLRGMVTFHFASCSAGTSKVARSLPMRQVQVAERSFIARLPQRLLAHPRGGALAVIGHVDETWRSSIEWSGTGQGIQTFEDAVRSLLSGQRVGAAMEPFGVRYAVLSVVLSDIFEDLHWGVEKKDDLARYWTASHDTRNYVVIGDPAVRLPVNGDSLSEPEPRPRFGSAKGRIKISEDFDEPLKDFKDYEP
jgi:hypothetical protein